MSLTCQSLVIISLFLIVLLIGGLAMGVAKAIPQSEVLAIIVVEINVVHKVMGTRVDDF
jgi:hypothetical protein